MEVRWSKSQQNRALPKGEVCDAGGLVGHQQQLAPWMRLLWFDTLAAAGGGGGEAVDTAT